MYPLVSDVTRLWQRTAEYMPLLVERLNRCGIPDENILIIVAVGTHRGQTPEEMERIVGSEIFQRVRVQNHDCDDAAHLRCVGRTPSGNEVYLNSYVLDCDRLILTGGTVLHFLAGFGGGAKSIIPGIASRDTVNRNHNLALKEGFGAGIHPLVKSGSMDGNPLRQDIDAGAALLFVSGGGFPKGINLRQTAKSLHCALAMAEKNATILLAAECSDDFGDEQIRRQIVELSDMQQRERELRSRFTIGAFVGFYFAQAAEEHHIILLTSMPKELFKSTKLHAVSTVEEAMEIARQLHGGTLNGMHAALLPGGGSVLPVVE